MPSVHTRFGQPVGELGVRVLEAFGEALDDAALLGGALLGEAVQAHLLGVVGQPALICAQSWDFDSGVLPGSFGPVAY